MASYDHAIPIEPWWLRLAKNLITNDDRGLVVLGQELAKRRGRQKPWHHSMLSRFVNGKIPATLELVEAICELYRLPMPIFFPRSLEEALEMTVVKERYDGRVVAQTTEPSPIASIERKSRRSNVSATSATPDSKSRSRKRTG